jgi:hypothetical protein
VVQLAAIACGAAYNGRAAYHDRPQNCGANAFP